jgi:hypothetical protein
MMSCTYDDDDVWRINYIVIDRVMTKKTFSFPYYVWNGGLFF